MASNLQLQPTPKRSPYVEQLLQPTEIQAFSKGPQIQEAILKALSKGLGGYFEGRERRRSEGVRDRLRDVIAGAKAPSGWVNPDAGWVPPEGVVDVSMVRQGRLIPEAERGDPRYRMSTDLMGRQGRDEPYTPRDIVPFRPDDPKGTVLADPTQLRGKEALFSAISTDPQLQSLVGSDIDPLTQVMMADLMQGQPRMLNLQELQDLGFAAGTVAQVNPDGTYNIIQDPPTPVKPTDTFRQASATQLHQERPNVFNAQWHKENKGTTWNINETTREMKKVGGGGQVFNFDSAAGPKTHDQIENEFTAQQESRGTAGKLLGSVKNLEALLDAGTATGPGEEWRQVARGVSHALGLSSEETDLAMARHETFRAWSNDVVLPRVKELGARPTDKDLQFIIDASPQLSNTPAGNRLILKALKIKAQRDLDRANAWDDYLDITGDPTDPLYDEELAKYAFATPEDIKEGRSSNWDFIGNAKLKSNWTRYSRARALKFNEKQKGELGTLQDDINKLMKIDIQELSAEARRQALIKDGFIIPIKK